jgi:hypothetical protein
MDAVQGAKPVTIPCPLRPGIHAWIWPSGRGEGWETARRQAQRLLDLGVTGAIPQDSLASPAWLAGRDVSETVTRAQVFQELGLQVTAGLGLDGHEATREAIGGAIVGALQQLNVNVMLDWESETKWECRAGRALAADIVDDVYAKMPYAHPRVVDAPWWEPEMHDGAPDREWGDLASHCFVQTYGAPSKDNPTEDSLWMLAHARALYPARGVPATAVHPAWQAYGHSLSAAAALVLADEPVSAIWDIEEMDTPMRQALLARKRLTDTQLPATIAGLKSWQAAHELTADGILGPLTLAAMRIT